MQIPFDLAIILLEIYPVGIFMQRLKLHEQESLLQYWLPSQKSGNNLYVYQQENS